MIRVLLKRLAVFTLALCAGVLCSGSLHAASMNEVSCSGFTLSYDGPSATSRCYELDEEGNQTEVKIQRLVAKGASFEMVVTYSAGKFHTYFPIRSLRQQVEENAYFSDTDNWQAEQKFGGFDMAIFQGFAKAGDLPALCVAFSRYGGQSTGPYEYDGGVGFRNIAEGLYCALSGQAALVNPPDNFYRLIEGVIGQLQFPP